MKTKLRTMQLTDQEVAQAKKLAKKKFGKAQLTHYVRESIKEDLAKG